MFRVRDRQIAEDLVQEALLAAWKGYGKFQGRSSEKTWLTTILHNKIVDFVRKASRENLVFTEDELVAEKPGEFDDEGRVTVDHRIGAWAMRPDQLAHSGEFWEVLMSCIGKLPPDIGEVFKLREIDGLSTEEICKQKRIQKNNYWVIMHRARKGLRECLTRNWFGKT